MSCPGAAVRRHAGSIAAGPLLFPTIWHRHYGKIAACWSVLALAALAAFNGAPAAAAALVHAMLAEYLSFIVLLFASMWWPAAS